MHIQNDSMKDASLWNLRGKGKVTTAQGTYTWSSMVRYSVTVNQHDGKFNKFKVTTST